MKKHAIIPIFIPHLGCNNLCVFCNQQNISGRLSPMKLDDMRNTIERNLSTIEGRGIEDIQIAFYGGSFTGLDIDMQTEYLKLANTYIKDNKVNSIRLSTRPDYINENILLNLKKYGVKTIELGVQSFDEDVLLASKRGHHVEDVIKSSKMIKDMGFELGIQLMIGLPMDSMEKSIYSANMAVELGAKNTRIYPCLIIKETELEQMFLNGEFKPFSLEDTIDIGSKMYRIFYKNTVDLIRVGLKASEFVESNLVYKENYHPSYRQLVETKIFREDIEEKIKDMTGNIILSTNSKYLSSLVGYRAENKEYFKNKFKHMKIKYRVNNNLEKMDFSVIN